MLPDVLLFLSPRELLHVRLFPEGLGAPATGFMVKQAYGKPAARIAGGLTIVVLFDAANEVVGNAGVEGIVTTNEHVQDPFF
jgi:hypothetical protein